jgi:protein-tyrosine kinase
MDRLTFFQVSVLSRIAEIGRIWGPIAAHIASFQTPAVLVTSACRGEGKTTMTALLSAAAARQSKGRILSVDLNWHQPALHVCFGLERSFDLGEFRIDRDIARQARPSGLENLQVLPAPPADTTALLAGGDPLDLGLMIVEQARAGYDLVLIDSSSIFPTNRFMIDPVVVGGAAAGVVMVVQAAVTPRESVKKALAAVEATGGTVVGTVVNQWRNPLA